MRNMQAPKITNPKIKHVTVAIGLVGNALSAARQAPAAIKLDIAGPTRPSNMGSGLQPVDLEETNSKAVEYNNVTRPIP